MKTDDVDWEVEHGRQRRARMAAEKICRQVIGDALVWKQEAEAFRALLAEAPHGWACDFDVVPGLDRVPDDAECTCWKAGL